MMRNRRPKLHSKFLAATIGICIAMGIADMSPVQAETIGISIPLSGDAAELGRKFRIGAKLAMDEIGQGHKLFIADDGCDIELAEIAAIDLGNANPSIVTGFLCNDVAIHTADRLKDRKIPMLVAGARSIRLIKDREREEWNLWRMSPGDDYAYQVAADFIATNWRETPFAVVDDGTIYGRTFTDNLRIQLDQLGVKEQFSDSFRAAQSTQAGLLRRLERSGVKAAFIAAATTEDLVTIAQDMENTGVKLDLLVSEQLAVLPFLEAAPSIAAGIKIVMETRWEDEGLNRILYKNQIEYDPQIIAGYTAIQVAVEAINAQGNSVADALRSKDFLTVIGRVKFDENGRNITNPYIVLSWDGQKLKPVLSD